MTLADVAGAERLADLSGLLTTCEVGGFTADFISWGFYHPVAWRNYWHTHSFHEVCLAYAGEGRFSIGDDAYDVGTGDVFLARPGDVHEIESSTSDPLGIAHWGFTLRPAGPAPDGPGWWTGLTGTDGPVLSRRTGSLPEVVTALAGQAGPLHSGYDAALAGLGAALVVDTARAFAGDLRVQRPPADRLSALVATMRRHLADNLSRPVTVRDVAAVVHLSERHAERLFREHTGASLIATLRRLRLERAAQLLLESDTSTVTAIARECGYPDVRAFSTAFRRRYGQPPLEYRTRRGTRLLSGDA